MPGAAEHSLPLSEGCPARPVPGPLPLAASSRCQLPLCLFLWNRPATCLNYRLRFPLFSMDYFAADDFLCSFFVAMYVFSECLTCHQLALINQKLPFPLVTSSGILQISNLHFVTVASAWFLPCHYFLLSEGGPRKLGAQKLLWNSVPHP